MLFGQNEIFPIPKTKVSNLVHLEKLETLTASEK